jgi:hypothetical protein
MKINEVLDKMGDGTLTTEAKEAIVEAFESAVDSKVNERVELEVANVVERIDEDHSQKLTTLLEAVDNDHTQKLINVVQKVDEDHTKKLKHIIKRYDSILKEEAAKFRDSFIDEISNYMELYLDKAIPKQQIAEATQNSSARKMIEEIKKIVAVDKAFISENIKEALKDGKQTIDGLKGELNKVIQENVMLNKNFNKARTALLLEKNTSNFSDEKRNYIFKVLGDKKPEYVKENLNYVVEMYNRDVQDERELIKEEASKNAVSKNVEAPKSVLESVSRNITSDDRNSGTANIYLDELKKF